MYNVHVNLIFGSKEIISYTYCMVSTGRVLSSCNETVIEVDWGSHVPVYNIVQ